VCIVDFQDSEILKQVFESGAGGIKTREERKKNLQAISTTRETMERMKATYREKMNDLGIFLKQCEKKEEDYDAKCRKEDELNVYAEYIMEAMPDLDQQIAFHSMIKRLKDDILNSKNGLVHFTNLMVEGHKLLYAPIK